MAEPPAVGLLGGGVIGAGWAARFLLGGCEVRVFDPAPQAPERGEAVLENARRALARLTLSPPPPEGRLTWVGSAEEAAEGVALVQESGPEREELKRGLLAAASRAAGSEAILASSTSGLLPTRLAADVRGPERFCVGHPFNPVYLLPLVEVCGGERTAPEPLQRAAALYRAVGLHPLVVRREIDGFLADRLLDALWREALWLVHDDVATVEEIDDAIRYGAGLRWAVMGTFMTYRIGGGDAGMRHFMAQFGPALQWPWSHLTDVPELTGELLDRIVAQSDAQAGGRSVRELERLRDDGLVAILQGLRAQELGAGRVVADFERARFGTARPVTLDDLGDLARPLDVHRGRVPAEWVDYNGHCHESRYLQVFGDAADALFALLGVDAAYLDGARSFYTVEAHLSLLREARAGTALAVTAQLLGADARRLHLFFSLHRADAGGELLAAAEQMFVHVDAATGRSGDIGPAVLSEVERLAAAHAGLARPARAGRHIELRPRRPPVD